MPARTDPTYWFPERLIVLNRGHLDLWDVLLYWSDDASGCCDISTEECVRTLTGQAPTNSGRVWFGGWRDFNSERSDTQGWIEIYRQGVGAGVAAKRPAPRGRLFDYRYVFRLLVHPAICGAGGCFLKPSGYVREGWPRALTTVTQRRLLNHLLCNEGRAGQTRVSVQTWVGEFVTWL